MENNWILNELRGGTIQWDSWNPRMRRIFDLVYPDIMNHEYTSVMDLGAGQMYLKDLLPSDIAYYPVDYLARCPETLVYDFNKHEFPEQKADLVVAAGIMHYVQDTDWWLKEIQEHCGKTFVLTYTPVELEGDIKKREELFLWGNHYSYTELYECLIKHGFLPVHVEKGNYDNKWTEHVILVLKKSEAANLPDLASCSGCGICAMECPASAIQMRMDREGFARPEFDSEKCIGCQKCMRKCPSLNIDASNQMNPDTYAFWADEDVRSKSSSGGAFSVLADAVLKKGGYVCGAAYDKYRHSISHMIVQDEAGLCRLRGSKYVQSDIQPVLEPIKRLLETQGAPVLFTGCPCQIAALKAYLGKSYDQLYLADLLCAGVTAPQVFTEYLEDSYDLDRISNVNFRTKQNGWDPFWLTVTYDNGEQSVVGIATDPMEQLFHSLSGMRQSCYACVFSAFPRQGDLTMGDFWGIQNYDAVLDDNKGTSFVSVNNEKGRKLYEMLEQNAAMIKPVPWQYTGTNRLFPFLSERSKMPETREYFYHLREKRSFGEAVNRALQMKFDVGVVCNWSGDNYGAQITQYAFYHVLTRMGLEPIMIERPKMPWPGGNDSRAGLFRMNPYPSYAMCPLFSDIEEMRAINNYADTFIVPSDQLWNALFAEKDLFALGYIANNKKKISYATSFGCDPHNWSEDERAREAFFLKQFDAISVREDSGIRILRESFGVSDAVQTLDPVFLCEDDFYDELCKKSRYSENRGHIAAFILDPNPEKAELIRKLSRKTGKPSFQITDSYKREERAKQWDLPVEMNVFTEDLLAVIKNSDYVITDSFHGVCFAVLFRKPFLAIVNQQRGMARFLSILRLFHLEDRLIFAVEEADTDVLEKPVDYSLVEAVLHKERKKSLEWLKNALQMPKKADLTAYDILDEKLYQRGKDLEKYKEQNKGIFAGIDNRLVNIDKELLRVNQNTDAVNSELLRVNQNIDAVSSELLRINKNTDLIDSELLRINQNADAVNRELLSVNKRQDATNKELLRINQNTDAVNSELLRINQNMDAVSSELLRINKNTDLIDAELLRINQNADAVNAELLRINQRGDAFNEEILKLRNVIDEYNSSFLLTKKEFEELYSIQENELELYRNTLEKQTKRIREMSSKIEMLSDRLERLEKSLWQRFGRLILWIPQKILNAIEALTN